MRFSKYAIKIFLAVFVAVALCVPMVGCMGSQSTNASADKELAAKLDPVEANKQYMATVNGKASELAHELSNFSDYVAKADGVNVKLVVDRAGAILDSIKQTEAPEQMKDIHASYCDAIDNLKSALTSYAEVFSANVSNLENGSLSAEDEAKLKDAQDKYDKSVESFNKADEAAKSDESLFSKNVSNAKK